MTNEENKTKGLICQTRYKRTKSIYAHTPEEKEEEEEEEEKRETKEEISEYELKRKMSIRKQSEKTRNIGVFRIIHCSD